jgi:hypothetical protein
MITMTETKTPYNAAPPQPDDGRIERKCAEGHHIGYTRKEKNVSTLYIDCEGLMIRVEGGAKLYCPECKRQGVKTLFRWHVGLDFIESLEKRKNAG